MTQKQKVKKNWTSKLNTFVLHTTVFKKKERKGKSQEKENICKTHTQQTTCI